MIILVGVLYKYMKPSSYLYSLTDETPWCTEISSFLKLG